MDYFYETEDRDGVRFTWNIWPADKIESTKNIVPLACMYTPLKNNNTFQISSDPLMCRGSCKTIISPYAYEKCFE